MASFEIAPVEEELARLVMGACIDGQQNWASSDNLQVLARLIYRPKLDMDIYDFFRRKILPFVISAHIAALFTSRQQ